MVIDSPSFLNKALIFFPILSSTGPLLLIIAASLSSLYSSTFYLPIKLESLARRYKPTSSQIVAPSKLPIVTSNDVSSPFLTQVPSLLKSSDFSVFKFYHVDNIIPNFCKRFSVFNGFISKIF